MSQSSDPSTSSNVIHNSSLTASQGSTGLLSSAGLAQTVDRLSQDFGLSPQGRQQLHVFTIQANSTIAEMWLFAALLGHETRFQQFTTLIDAQVQRLNQLETLIRHEWQLTKAQEDAIKRALRHLVIVSTTSYRDLSDRMKTYVGRYPGQFSLNLYLTDSAVTVSVNKFIEKDTHQVRGSLRKLIFAAAVGNRSLDGVVTKICTLYTSEYANGLPPISVKAHIAQLRQIAFGIVNSTHNAPSVPSTSSAPPAKRPKNDTGFWIAVDAKFVELVAMYGNDYKATGWREWETAIIEEDLARFDGQANLFTQEVINLYAPGVYN
ncbi:hypothetical protein RhiJN_24943 [Ceratobasidium sp. AG-Ba]|nr:hypothetical protein RhiJN_24943 [Ceratobasidium sp. AG-Ba]